jgi:hypothetical protein
MADSARSLTMVDDDLPEELELVGHAVGDLGTMRKPRNRKIAMASRRRGDDVGVDGQAEDVNRRVDANRDGLCRVQHPHSIPP